MASLLLTAGRIAASRLNQTVNRRPRSFCSGAFCRLVTNGDPHDLLRHLHPDGVHPHPGAVLLLLKAYPIEG